MAGKTRHMINRSGRYHARLVVPKDLRQIVGESELREPLGGDYRHALKMLCGAVARLQPGISLAEREAGRTTRLAPRYPFDYIERFGNPQRRHFKLGYLNFGSNTSIDSAVHQ